MDGALVAEGEFVVRVATARLRSSRPMPHWALVAQWQPPAGLVIAVVLPVFYGLSSEGWATPWPARG